MTRYPLVLVDGPPRCGKSTLARQLAASASAGAILARAGSPEGQRLIANPLALSAARPVILDGASKYEARILGELLAEHSRKNPAGANEPYSSGKTRPVLPAPLKPVDDTPQAGWRSELSTGSQVRLPRFVLVGGPFGKARARDGWESPLPFYTHISLGPLTLTEVGRGSVRAHWLRGGYPEAYTADHDRGARAAIADLIEGLSGGRLRPWGLPDSPSRLVGLLTVLAQGGSGLVNENQLARLMDTTRPTICRWMEGMEQAGILRRLPRLPGPRGARRTIQAPAWYIRDSGLIHGLIDMEASSGLRTMPSQAGASWNSYVLEQTAVALGPGTELGSYLSADKACIDLVLTRGDRIIAASTRIRPTVSVGRGTSGGAAALGATHRYLVVPDGPTRYVGGGFKVIGLGGFLDEAHSLLEEDWTGA